MFKNTVIYSLILSTLFVPSLAMAQTPVDVNSLLKQIEELRIQIDLMNKINELKSQIQSQKGNVSQPVFDSGPQLLGKSPTTIVSDVSPENQFGVKIRQTSVDGKLTYEIRNNTVSIGSKVWIDLSAPLSSKVEKKEYVYLKGNVTKTVFPSIIVDTNYPGAIGNNRFGHIEGINSFSFIPKEAGVYNFTLSLKGNPLSQVLTITVVDSSQN